MRAERHEDDVGTRVDGGNKTGDDVAVEPCAVRAEHGDRHHAHVGPGDTRDADVVVGIGRDDAGHPRAVPIGIRVGRLVLHERFAGQEVLRQVLMRRVHPGVQDRHDRAALERRVAACLFPVNLRQVPLILVERIADRRLRGPFTVLFDAHDRFVATHRVRVGCRIIGRDFDDNHPQLRNVVDERAIPSSNRAGDVVVGRRGVERDDVANGCVGRTAWSSRLAGSR